MPTWKGEGWLGSSAGRQTLTVKANTITGAKEQMQRIYGAESICNLRQVKEDGTSGSQNIGGYGALLAFLMLIWVFISFMPWITMLAGGALGGWLSGKILGTNMQEAMENDKGKLVAIIALTALLSGGLGFVKGHDWREWLNAQTETEAKLSTTQKQEQPLQGKVVGPYWIYLGMAAGKGTGSSLSGTITTTSEVVPNTDEQAVVTTTKDVAAWPYSTASRGEPKGQIKKGSTLELCNLAFNQLDNGQYAVWAEVAPGRASCPN